MPTNQQPTLDYNTVNQIFGSDPNIGDSQPPSSESNSVDNSAAGKDQGAVDKEETGEGSIDIRFAENAPKQKPKPVRSKNQ